MKITQKGYEMSGEAVGSPVYVNETYKDHHLCGENETPYSLVSDYPTKDLYKVVFLTEGMVE